MRRASRGRGWGEYGAKRMQEAQNFAFETDVIILVR